MFPHDQSRFEIYNTSRKKVLGKEKCFERSFHSFFMKLCIGGRLTLKGNHTITFFFFSFL
jgi:hypothetical protein